LRDAAIHDRAAKKGAERETAVYRDTPEDERLTSPSVVEAMKSRQAGSVPDPDRQTRIAEKLARVKAREAQKEEEKQDALHVLYMNARGFITTEQQLHEEIERAFSPSTLQPVFGKPRSTAPGSIWDQGRPKTIRDMLREGIIETKRTSVRADEASRLAAERVNRIAGELTGGKL
jgi:hypothetical protein